MGEVEDQDPGKAAICGMHDALADGDMLRMLQIIVADQFVLEGDDEAVVITAAQALGAGHSVPTSPPACAIFSSAIAA